MYLNFEVYTLDAKIKFCTTLMPPCIHDLIHLAEAVLRSVLLFATLQRPLQL